MNELERMRLLSSARKLKEREDTPAPFEDPYSDMTPDEKSKMIMELVASRERDAERIRRDEARIDALLSKVDELLCRRLPLLQKRNWTIINNWSVICCLK